jgi:hypothetical protein
MQVPYFAYPITIRELNSVLDNALDTRGEDPDTELLAVYDPEDKRCLIVRDNGEAFISDVRPHDIAKLADFTGFHLVQEVDAFNVYAQFHTKTVIIVHDYATALLYPQHYGYHTKADAKTAYDTGGNFMSIAKIRVTAKPGADGDILIADIEDYTSETSYFIP